MVIPSSALPLYLFDQHFLVPSQLHALSLLLQQFAKKIEKHLSYIFQEELTFTLSSLKQSPLTIISHLLPQETIRAQFEMLPSYAECGIFLLEEIFAYRISSKLLGGEGQLAHQPASLSPIELAMTRKFITTCLRELEKTLEPLNLLSFRLDKLENKPETHLPLAPYGAHLVSHFKMQHATGILYLLIIFPHSSIKILKPPLDYYLIENKIEFQQGVNHFEEINIELTASFGQLTLSFEELSLLEVGDILDFSVHVFEPLIVTYAREPVFRGIPGLQGSSKAILLKSLKE